MTEQQASKIRSCFANGVDFKENCMGIPDEYQELAELMNEAIKKQIPKKPIPDKEQTIRYVMTFTCPTCGKGFTGTKVCSYCYHCGQALDWR